MSISPWFFTMSSVTLTAIAHLVFKMYAVRGDYRRLALAVGLFMLVPVSTFMALQELSLAQVYLSMSAVPILSLLAAQFLLRESLDRTQLFATGLIVTGIVVFQSAAFTS